MPKPTDGLLPIQFAPGVREDLSKMAAPPGSLRRAWNVRYGHAGQIECRPGSLCVPPTCTTTEHVIQNNTEGIGVVSRIGNAPLLGLNGKLFAQDPTSSVFQFQGLYGTARPIRRMPSLTTFTSTSFGTSKYGIAVSSAGYICMTACSAGGWYFSIQSAEGVELALGSGLGSKAAVVAQGTGFVIVSQNGSSLSIMTVAIASGVVTLGAVTPLATLSASDCFWDISAYTSSSYLLVYQSNATTLVIANQTAGVTNYGNTWIVTGKPPVSVWGDGTSFAYLGYVNNPSGTPVVSFVVYNTSALSLVPFNSGSLSTTAGFTYGPPLFGKSLDPNSIAFFVFAGSKNASTPFNRTTGYGWVSSSGSISGFTNLNHVTPISKPDSSQRAWLMTGNEAANWVFQRPALLRFYNTSISLTGTAIELIGPETERPNTTNLPSRIVDLFAAVAEGTSSHHFLIPELLQPAQNSQPNDLIRLTHYSYEVTSIKPRQQAIELGDTTVVLGQATEFFGVGTARDYNGSVLQDSAPTGGIEVGYAYRPAVLVATQGTGGNLTVGGTYAWIFVYQWYDSLGRLHESPASIPYTTTLTGSNTKVDFTLPSLDWHQKQNTQASLVTVAVYRTQPGGTQYQRENLPDSAVAATGDVINYSSGSIASHSDVNISANAFVYTDGGDIDNAMPPSGAFGCNTEQRLWIGGEWEPSVISCSKIRVAGEPTKFTESSSFDVDIGEPCTGLAAQDGNVVAFAKRSIYVVADDGGPNDQGSGQFPPPRLISRDIGCIDARSILETSSGILFQGERGYYLLPRGFGEPQLVGRAIQDSQGTYPTCLGAAYFADKSNRLAQFLVTSGAAERVFTFDLDSGAWIIDSYTRRLGAVGAWPTGTFLGLTSLASASICGYLANAGIAQDAEGGGVSAESITSLLETNSIRPWGMAGWGQLSSILSLNSAVANSPAMTLTLTQDGVSTDVFSWTGATATEDSFHHVLPVTKVQCSSFRIQETAVRPASATVTFHGIQITQEPLGERRTKGSERG